MEPGMKILFVDDLNMALRTYQLMCASIDGVRTDVASSGQEALELLEQNNYDILFTDYNMPGMNGVALIRHARALGREMKIVMISATPPDDHGADDVLEKPVGKGLKQFILAHLQQRKKVQK